MSVIWKKVWFDLWQNKLRTLLVVLSIAAGVFAVGTTFGLIEQLIPTMDASHRSTSPSHATMMLGQPVDRDTILNLKKIPGVLEIEPLNELEIRYKVKAEEDWRQGNLVMRADYSDQDFDVIQLKGGSWPEEKSLSIERMHSPYYGIGIGDQVIIEVDDKEHLYPISGLIRHPFVPPPAMWDLAFFFSGEQVMESFGIPPGRFNELKFQVVPYSPQHVREVASDIKRELAKQGISVSATLYQDPETHWGRAFIDGTVLVLQVLAVLSMLLSVVLVLNTFTAVITQQTNQIGIIKAIGGSRNTIIRVYLVGVFILGLLALFVALPLGSWASFQMSRWMLGMYNIEYERFLTGGNALLFQVFAALAVPLIAALVPVLSGAAITVREAIASYGVGGDYSAGLMDRFIERVGRGMLRPSTIIAITNTFRRKWRLVLTQLVLVISGVMFLMVMGLSSSMKRTLDVEFERREHDFILYFDQLMRIDRITEAASRLDNVQDTGMWLALPATILHGGQRRLDAGMGSQLQGIPVENPMIKPMVVEGRWLMPGDQRAVVMNADTAEDEGIQVGDTLTLDMGDLGEENWMVVGIYRTFMMFGSEFNYDVIYAPQEAVFDASKKHGHANMLLVRTRERGETAIDRTVADLEDLLREKNMPADLRETMPDTRRIIESGYNIVVAMILFLAVIMAVVGGIGLMGALSIGVIERTREIGVMRALGALSGTILGMFVLEGLVQGVLSWMVAVPISLLATPWMAAALGETIFNTELVYRFNYSAVLIWLGVVILVSILASIIPAYRAAQVNVRQSLTYE
ncbi:MAG: FtsX-like permease family protein [Anaerolineales bacterium]